MHDSGRGAAEKVTTPRVRLDVTCVRKHHRSTQQSLPPLAGAAGSSHITCSNRSGHGWPAEACPPAELGLLRQAWC